MIAAAALKPSSTAAHISVANAGPLRRCVGLHGSESWMQQQHLTVVMITTTSRGGNNTWQRLRVALVDTKYPLATRRSRPIEAQKKSDRSPKA